MISIRRYSNDDKAQWDDFVTKTKNATFLHMRDYMDYHSDRFADFSLIAHDGGDIVAVLPACFEGDCLFSHRGLTYGGWLMPLKHFDVTTMLEIWDRASTFLRDSGLSRIVYKPVPHIYHSYPAEEDLYALFGSGASLVESNISTVIDLTCALPYDRGNKRNLNFAVKNNVSLGESTSWDAYWHMLDNLLVEKYDKHPVHSLEEIKMLSSRFQDNIKLYTATVEDELLAGVVMYYCGSSVAHCQYIASTARGRELKALTALFHYLIKQAAEQGFRYFDFGTSNENGGRYLNMGLVRQKCRMGGRGIVYNTYQIDL